MELMQVEPPLVGEITQVYMLYPGSVVPLAMFALFLFQKSGLKMQMFHLVAFFATNAILKLKRQYPGSVVPLAMFHEKVPFLG